MRAVHVVCLSLLAAAPVAAEEFAVFQSPSGNISCMMADSGDMAGARCDILEATPSFARRPADCDVDWGHAFVVGSRGPGVPICYGDTVADPRAPVLNYGASITRAGVTCTSERTGMTCVNSRGHGFTMARAGQSVF